jgi:prepilin-type N-terminal cleavage/methylation domain-containing protein
MNKKAFTLLEMIIVVVVIAVLASIGVPRYVRAVEKGRTSEALGFLGHIREAEIAYYMEYNTFTSSLAALSTGAPAACSGNFYFNYTLGGTGTTFTATANRCTASGRAPNALTAYRLNITNTGALGGTTGFV